MSPRKRQPKDIEAQLEEFEEANPAVAEAINLFGMTMEEYQQILNTLHQPNVITTNSTVWSARIASLE